MKLRTARSRPARCVVVCTTASIALALVTANAGALTINQWTGYPGTDVWGNAANWTGGVPNSGDQATIYGGPVTLYSAPASIGGLLVAHLGATGQVFTNGFKLNVLNRIDLDGANAGLYAYTAPSGSVSVQTPILDITGGGLLDMMTGGAKVRVSSTASGTANGTLSVDATSRVLSYGTLDTDTYTNNGLLQSEAGASTINAGTFTLAGTAANVATIDADAEAMTINATSFDLHDIHTKIDVSDFQGSLTLNGTTINGNIGSDVVVGDSAQLTLSGGGFFGFGYIQKSGAIFVRRGSVALDGGTTAARAAKVTGYGTYYTDVDVSGYATMSSGEFEGGSDLTLAASSVFTIGSPYFRGATNSTSIDVNGTGTIHTNGDMGIGYSGSGIPYTNVTIESGVVFDWDGSSESAASCTIANGELNILTSTIDTFSFFTHFGYDGAISIAGDSKLNVAGTIWTLYGTMSLAPGAIVQGQTMLVDGSYLPAGTNSITPGGSGGVYPTIQAPLGLEPNSSIYLVSGAGLNLNGTTTYAGGGIYSAPYVTPGQPYGTIEQNANAFVTGNTTLYCNTFNMDGTANTSTWTVNAGVTLTQQAYSLDVANSTSNPVHSAITLNGGTLDMETNLGFWTLAGGTLKMTQSGINLPFLTHDKLVLGSGATNGTVIVGVNTTAYISGGLQSAATSVAGGNVIDIGSASTLYVGPTFGSAAGATLTKSGPGTMIVNVAQSHAAGSTINVTAGELDLNSDAGAGGANLSIVASGGLAKFSTNQRLTNLTINGSGAVTLTSSASPAAATVIVASLNMTGGKLDLTRNDMIVHSGNLATLRTLLAQGYNGGTWNGASGIESSTAAASTTPRTAIGYALNNDGTGTRLFVTFDGQPASLTDVILKYTTAGDANLDGKTDFYDLLALAKSYGTAGTTWTKGDFDYDGATDFGDLLVLAKNYNQALPASAAEIDALNAAGGPAFAAQFALATSLAPEPASIGALGLAALCVARRRTPRA